MWKTKKGGQPTEQHPEIDVDEESSPLDPEQGLIRPSPVETETKKTEPASCEDVFCETKTVDESSLMKLSQQDRDVQLHQSGAAGGK